MTAAGFSSKQRQRSSWLFQPCDGKVVGLKAVIFHMNHGSNDRKIDSIKLRKMAGDLEGNFGWNLGVFVVEGK